MSDVFISYARSTAPQAQAIAAALRALGYAVWRDDELPAHRAYADVIQERLRAAKAVVVVWSAEAAKSEWVRSEAERARTERKLVQLTVDNAELPMPFDQIQCADLAGWTGADTAGWRKVTASLADLIPPASSPAAASAPRQLSVCVLPFANMSGDAEQEYFSDGISEDIITDLSKVSALSVVSRNSAFQFKGQHVDVRQVARQLDVSHVLEGSVRKAGNRVRITAQLIEGSSDSHLWAERYDRDLDDIFAVQDEISEAIVAALKLKLLPAEKSAIERRGTQSAEAYDLYLMARQHGISGNVERQGLGVIIRLCRRAIEIDPDYAQAWALLAKALGSLHFRYGDPADEVEAATDRALQLGPDLGEAHAVKARLLSARDQPVEATAEAELALRLDPESFEVNSTAGYVYFRRGRFAEAARHYELAASQAEAAFGEPAMLMTCYQALGDQAGRERAARLTLERAERAVALDPGNSHATGYVAGALACLGQTQRARDWMKRALIIHPDNRNMRYNFICSFSADFGDADAAVELLGPYLAGATAAEIGHFTIDPDIDPIRADPRVQALVAEAEARVAGTS